VVFEVLGDVNHRVEVILVEEPERGVSVHVGLLGDQPRRARADAVEFGQASLDRLRPVEVSAPIRTKYWRSSSSSGESSCDSSVLMCWLW